VPAFDGDEPAVFDVERTGRTVRVRATGTDAAWSVRAEPADGSSAVEAHASAGTAELELTLPE
jgi:hypothetical protein